MRKGLIVTVVIVFGLAVGGTSTAQQPSRYQMGHGMGHGGWMGPGGGMMGPGGGMMGAMMGSPELMGAMMSIHGEIMSLMGTMMQKYGGATDRMTPELRQQMQREVLQRMGEILTKHGTALKERAKAAGK